ncbi:MAG TPA: hypothetical protein PKA00_06930 [Saprospiraceae bacterium]|nr:hypothetical protein [Saprospiraceae bacterium]HMQ82622.1 hypothetical protein [Saprospiraceae bacterium]
MLRLSSNLTLFFKIFVPVFWIVFNGAVTIAILVYPFEYIGDIKAIYIRLGMVFIYLSGLALLAFTIMRLKRVEADQHFFYITNYFKTARYPFEDVEQVERSRFLLLKTATFTLKAKGIFGRSIFFIASSRFEEFWEENPELTSMHSKG